MASGRGTTSTVPSTWTQGPKKPSESTHRTAAGSRRRFFTFMAVSRLLMTSTPSSATATVIGEVWGRPSRRRVTSTARGLSRTKSSASPTSMRSGGGDRLGVHLELVHRPLHDAAGGLGGDAQGLAHLPEAAALAVHQAEALLDGHPGPGLEVVEEPGHLLGVHGVDHHLLGTGHGVGEQVDELLLAVVADGAVEAGGGGQAVQVGQLGVEVVALARDVPQGGSELGRALARQADQVRLLVEGPADGLADPEGGVGGELEALAPVELLHRVLEAEVALLDEVEELHARGQGVPAGDADHEPQVGPDEVV